MHTALYRKYRPKNFAGVVGQKYVVQALKNQIDSGKIGHAFLFTGTRGTGKTSCAKIFAKAVNCQNQKHGEPCLECDICKGIENGSIYDVVEMDAASNNSVEDIRDLLQEVNYLPVFAKYRVYIIDEVHMLSASAFNALLKTLEEPPSHVIFILATTELHKVPATILSRCQKYDFTKLSIEEIGEAIMDIAAQERLSITHGAAKRIATLADGAMRDASSILETCINSDEEITEDTVAHITGVAKDEDIFNFVKGIIEQDMVISLQSLLRLEKSSVDLKRMGEEIITHFRNLILANINGSTAELLSVPQEKFDRLKAQSATTNQQFLSGCLSVFAKSIEDMAKGQNPKIALDIAVYNICNKNVVTTIVNVSNTAQIDNSNNIIQPQTSVSVAESPIQTVNTDEKQSINSVENEKSNIVNNTTPPTVEKPIIVQPEIVQKEVPVEFTYWNKVIDLISAVDIPFYSFIKTSKAWLYDNIVYIDGNEGLNQYLRTNKEASAIVKKAILEACGRSYNIGGYRNLAKKFAPPVADKLSDLLALREKGVQVNIED